MDGKNVWIAVLAVGLVGTAFFAYESTHNPNMLQSATQATPSASSSAAPSAAPLIRPEARVDPALKERVQTLGDHAKDLEARLDQASQSNDSDRTKVADLEKQLADTRKELAATQDETNRQLAAAQAEADRQRNELAATQAEANRQKNDLAAAQADTNRQLNGVERRMARDQRDRAANVQSRRVAFEVTTDKTQEIAPGVSITVMRTDPDGQRFTARVFYQPDGRAFMMRDQKVNSPLVFFSKNGSDRFELVINAVKDGEAEGYVLVPTSS